MVRGYGLGAGGPEFNPHHVKLSGLQVRPFKVSGGSLVHLRSKHRATGSRTWKEDLLGQQKQQMYCVYVCIYVYVYIYIYIYIAASEWVCASDSIWLDCYSVIIIRSLIGLSGSIDYYIFGFKFLGQPSHMRARDRQQMGPVHECAMRSW